MLGPLFGDKAIRGPIMVCYIPVGDRHLYLVGEEHNTNGTTNEVSGKTRHVVDYIMSFPNKAACFVELSSSQLLQYASVVRDFQITPSPLYQYSYSYMMNQPKNHHLVFADIRKFSPYDIYLLIIDPMTYALQRYKENVSNHVVTVKKWAKKAEKVILKHIKTRNSAKSFLESLFMPDMDYPDWYKELSRELGQDLGSPLRSRMEALRSQNGDMYDKVVEHMRSYYSNWAVTPYSKAISKLERNRRTANSKMIASKNRDAKALFIELSSYLFDLEVILDFMYYPDSSCKTFFVLSGAAHTKELARFFGVNAVYSKSDAYGNIPSGEAKATVDTIPNMIPDALNRILA